MESALYGSIFRTTGLCRCTTAFRSMLDAEEVVEPRETEFIVAMAIEAPAACKISRREGVMLWVSVIPGHLLVQVDQVVGVVAPTIAASAPLGCWRSRWCVGWGRARG